MGAACGRCFGGGSEPHDGAGAPRRRRSGRRHKSASRQSATASADGSGVSADAHAAVAPAPPSPRRGGGAAVAAPAQPLHGAAHGKALASPRAAVAAARPPAPATLSRSESGALDLFFDASESFEDAAALAEAPYAFARHAALCAEPPGPGHRGCLTAAAAAEAAEAAAQAAAAAEGGAAGVDGPDKPAELAEIEALGKNFGDDFWAGKGSLAGRGLKALQALRHLKDIDLSKFSGVPISQHLPVSGSQMLHANSFMAGRTPPASRLDAHLRAELPAALSASPLERFLVVLRAHIALLDAPAQSLRKPFNPVLGETSRIIHFVEPNAPPIAAVCEQVSHHPPVTAFGSWDASLRWSYTGWVNIAPRFTGLSIKVPMTGQRELALPPLPGAPPGAPRERYRATIPAMEWHFVPSVRAEYSGTWRLWCDETGLAAEVTHPTKSFLGLLGRPNRIEGRVMRVAPPQPHVPARGDGGAGGSPRRRSSADADVLFTFDGEFDACVWLRPAGATARPSGARERSAPRLLWDAASAAQLEAAAPPPQSQPELEARSADAVWGAVFRALHEGAWDDARAGKEAVEVAERATRRERAARGVRWAPAWFEPDATTGGWAPRE